MNTTKTHPGSNVGKIFGILIAIFFILAAISVFVFVLFIALDPSFGQSDQLNASSNSPGENFSSISQSDPGRDPVVISDDILTLGNFVIPKPEGFTLTSSTENYALYTSDDGDCVIGVFAADVSEYSESLITNYLPKQHKSFMAEDAVISNSKDNEIAFGSYWLTFSIYSETDTDSIDTINIDTSFTDSWYCYTIMFRCNVVAGDLNDHVHSFAEFCGSAKYSGETPRFDFVQ